jgi:hypothetical protein
MNVREVILKKMLANNGSLFPVGRPFAGLPLITEMTYGLQGIFLLVGATKVGKTTAVAHLVAGALSEDFPGVYYEHEDGLAPERVALALGGDLDDPRLSHLGYAREFDKAVEMVRALPHGFLVVDTIQGSTSIEAHDPRLDHGPLHELEQRMKTLTELHRNGYAVLVVSQINDRTATAPPGLSAIKGASAIEQHATTVVAYGTAPRGNVTDPVRHLVLRRLRRPVHAAWPVNSAVALRTDGRDRLTEERVDMALVREPRPRKLSPAERVAQARAAHPEASVREIARVTGLSKSYVSDLLAGRRGVPAVVSAADGERTVLRTADSATAALG